MDGCMSDILNALDVCVCFCKKKVKESEKQNKTKPATANKKLIIYNVFATY